MAGAGGGATIFACWRGSGTIRRGAGTPCAEAEGADVTGGAATLTGEEATGVDTGGAATAIGRGGAALTAVSACLRSRIALSASPGFETLERSNLGFASTACRFEPELRPPPLKYSRTFSA
jgi:hypothetical protein